MKTKNLVRTFIKVYLKYIKGFQYFYRVSCIGRTLNKTCNIVDWSNIEYVDWILTFDWKVIAPSCKTALCPIKMSFVQLNCWKCVVHLKTSENKSPNKKFETSLDCKCISFQSLDKSVKLPPLTLKTDIEQLINHKRKYAKLI